MAQITMTRTEARLTRSMHMASKPLTFANVRMRFSCRVWQKGWLNPGDLVSGGEILALDSGVSENVG